jgi:hypothetical protein
MGFGCGNCDHVQRAADYAETGTGYCPIYECIVSLCEPCDCDKWKEEE